MNKFRKIVNRVLNDKDEFPLNDTLKEKIDLHNYLLDNVIVLEKYIVKEKLKYFWLNKKKVLFRGAVKFILMAFAIITIIGSAWMFGVKFYFEKEVVVQHPIVLYVPETTDTEYIRSCMNNDDVTFIILYPKDKSKNWDKFKHAIHKIESNVDDSLSYHSRRSETTSSGSQMQSQYWGRYQLGDYARRIIGIGDVSWEHYSNNPELQEGAFKTWMQILYKEMYPYISKYEGEYMAGMQVTSSGILAMTHNVGLNETVKFLESGGNYIPFDGYGPATKFMAIGGYDLSEILK